MKPRSNSVSSSCKAIYKFTINRWSFSQSFTRNWSLQLHISVQLSSMWFCPYLRSRNCSLILFGPIQDLQLNSVSFNLRFAVKFSLIPSCQSIKPHESANQIYSHSQHKTKWSWWRLFSEHLPVFCSLATILDPILLCRMNSPITWLVVHNKLTQSQCIPWHNAYIQCL